MPGSQFRFDLKTRIAAMVLLLFLGSIWLVAQMTVARLQDEFAQVLANQQYSSVSRAAEEIEQRMRLRFDSLSIVAKEISPEMIGHPVKVAALLGQRPLLATLFGNSLVVVAPDGTEVARYPPQAGRQSSGYEQTEYFSEVMARGKPALGKPRVGRFTQRPGVAFAVPIPGSGNRPAGVLVGFANLGDASLFGHIAEAKVGQTGWLAVNDARYRLIVAINDPERLLQPLPEPGINRMLDRFANGHEGSGISVNSQGREVLTSGKKIEGTDWFVQEVLPTDEAFEPIRDMKSRIYFIASVLSTLATLIAWLASRFMLAPLGKATREIRRMTEGQVDLHELPLTRHDEIGDLIGSFNQLFRQRRALQEELERQARTDALTGLPNRRYFLEVATAELARAARFGTRLSILMIDLDHFKRINDTHGHKTGDLVLRKFADTCRATLREIDVIARFGGEEFAALLPQTDHGAALEAAERLRLTLAETTVPLEQGLPVCFTVSIGVATRVDDSTNIDTLLSSADHALYEAKHLGRNRVCGGA